MNRSLLLLINCLIVINIFAQNTLNTNGFNTFHHPNGVKSSEGNMKDGKPVGYWKTFNEEGILIAEGNRHNFLLDSLWRFYHTDGRIAMEVNYLKGKKNGLRISYLQREIRKENFVNDIKEGLTTVLYPEGMLKQHLPFERGLENGISYIYNKKGGIIALLTFDRGYLTKRERINRYDSQKKKHGNWKWFYPNKKLQRMGRFIHGMEDGMFVDFNLDGSAISAKRYKNGLALEEKESYAEIEIRKTYYPNGQIKTETAYRDDKKHGLSKHFNWNGQVEESAFFYNGRLSGKGLISDNGLKQGKWFELYADSSIRAEGQYMDDKRFGQWLFYYPNNQLEQKGVYDLYGKANGEWIWYYPNGKLLRKESFESGKHEGPYVELNADGEILTQGKYLDGLKEGDWIIDIGDLKEVGKFLNDKRNGLWKFIHDNGKIAFQGKFVNDLPHGVHKFYNQRGKLIKQGKFMMGRKHGTWREYDSQGQLLIWITYNNGVEEEIDGVWLAK